MVGILGMLKKSSKTPYNITQADFPEGAAGDPRQHTTCTTLPAVCTTGMVDG